MNTTTPTHVALLHAVEFAAEKHRDQRRKGKEESPYINHPIAVAQILAQVGKVEDLATLQAAILHDTIEDTETTPDELEKVFGAEVRDLMETPPTGWALERKVQYFDWSEKVVSGCCGVNEKLDRYFGEVRARAMAAS